MQRFCLAHANAFVVPAEVLSEHGVEPAFGALLVHEKRLSAEQLACLNAGFGLYWQRCRALHAAAPGAWFPPRQTNLLVVADARGILPYLEPFRGTSSMLYTADLDTHPEYVAALLVHMERLSLLRSVPATVAYNLSYWFERDATSRQAFADAARRAHRPDAAAFVALAEAFGWIDELLHDPLRVPQQEPTEPHIHINGADLYVPKRLQPQLMALGAAAEDAVRAAMDGNSSGRQPTGAAALDELCDWLVESRAHVIVHGPHGGTLWTPQHDDPIRVRRVLADANDEAVASIHADLRLIDERSRQFLGRVRDVDALPTIAPCSRRAVAPMSTPRVARWSTNCSSRRSMRARGHAPPYHRLLLGARVMHEWGHIAHTAKILRAAGGKAAEYFAARSRTRRDLRAGGRRDSRTPARRGRRGTADDRAEPRRAAQGAGPQDAGARRRLSGQPDVVAPDPE